MPASSSENSQDTSGLGGHPKGLPTLFFIELGVCFLAAAFGNILADYLGGFFVADNPQVLVRLYGGIALGLLISMALLAFLTPQVRRLMGEAK